MNGMGRDGDGRMNDTGSDTRMGAGWAGWMNGYTVDEWDVENCDGRMNGGWRRIGAWMNL